mmetsp:Transcript_27722/g.63850  ORF Transcript_27722/g.63850 Transcript_27722/m.63850 type:complete len:233 (-) Transcript_27722:1286-1984(-)
MDSAESLGLRQLWSRPIGYSDKAAFSSSSRLALASCGRPEATTRRNAARAAGQPCDRSPSPRDSQSDTVVASSLGSRAAAPRKRPAADGAASSQRETSTCCSNKANRLSVTAAVSAVRRMASCTRMSLALTLDAIEARGSDLHSLGPEGEGEVTSCSSRSAMATDSAAVGITGYNRAVHMLRVLPSSHTSPSDSPRRSSAAGKGTPSKVLAFLTSSREPRTWVTNPCVCAHV